jgi:hypothetical protein
MAEDAHRVAAQAQAADQNVMIVNELKTLFSNPKGDIPILYGDHTKNSITPNFFLLHQNCISNLPLVRCSNSL